jgi:hypothetical protein
MKYYTEDDLRKDRIKYNFSQLDEDQIMFCVAEAKRLQKSCADNPEIEDNSLDSWLECISESLRLENERHYGQYCAEMGEQ